MSRQKPRLIITEGDESETVRVLSRARILEKLQGTKKNKTSLIVPYIQCHLQKTQARQTVHDQIETADFWGKIQRTLVSLNRKRRKQPISAPSPVCPPSAIKAQLKKHSFSHRKILSQSLNERPRSLSRSFDRSTNQISLKSNITEVLDKKPLLKSQELPAILHLQSNRSRRIFNIMRRRTPPCLPHQLEGASYSTKKMNSITISPKKSYLRMKSLESRPNKHFVSADFGSITLLSRWAHPVEDDEEINNGSYLMNSKANMKEPSLSKLISR